MKKRGRSARPAPTVRRARAQKYEIPRLLRKSRRLLRENAQLFAKTGLLFSPFAHDALPHRPPCAENPQVGVENARARHIKTHFRLQKRPLTTEKCFTYDSTPPQNSKKTTPFGLHLSTTHQKARRHTAPLKNKALKMSAFPIFMCTFAESLRTAPLASRAARSAERRFLCGIGRRREARRVPRFSIRSFRRFFVSLSCFLSTKGSMHLYTLTSNQKDLWRKN